MSADLQTDFYVNVVRGFWEHVHRDLELGMAPSGGDYLGLQAFLFMHSDDFRHWATLTSGIINPDAARDRILDSYWPASEQRPPLPEPGEEFIPYKKRVIGRMAPLAGNHRLLA